MHAQVTVNGPAAYGSYVGESEANLRRIFGQAAMRAEHGPVVLFIDEIVCRATLHRRTSFARIHMYHFVSYQPLGAKSRYYWPLPLSFELQVDAVSLR
jgi:hypothetical protein